MCHRRAWGKNLRSCLGDDVHLLGHGIKVGLRKMSAICYILRGEGANVTSPLLACLMQQTRNLTCSSARFSVLFVGVVADIFVESYA